MDERVHMQRFRQGARGSATTFLLDWEWLLNEFQNLETITAETHATLLPRSGEDLRKYVSVILKSRDKDIRAEDVKHLVHQATVRRHVVVMLIQNAVRREHPAYKHVDLEAMLQRAETVLPENDVPAEVVALLESDEATELLYKQKNAAPIAEPDTVDEAILELSLQRPNAVVLEKSGCDVIDGEGQQEAALRALAEDIAPDQLAEEDCDDALAEQADETVPERQIVSSTTPMDQFAPWYFGVAFAFLFKYCTAMPDPPNYGKYADKRWRRNEAAPRVTLQDWTRLMSQRIESQLNRDWTFGYTSWNILFRSAVNLSRSVYAYDTPVRTAAGEWQTLTPSMLEDAACEIIQGLKGSYRTPEGRFMPVKGNLNLVRFLPNLSPTAQRILANLSHTARKVPGTQEARRIMRFEIQAMRIRYGTPIFVTVTPDEAHSLLYVRMSRHRRSDPIRRPNQHCNARSGDRRWPALDQDLTLECPFELFQERRATWEEHRRILARDPLATVHGFRVTLFLVMKHLFGMNVCLQCPSCNCGSMPCQDWQGSNATCTGGIFGRCDAAYVAIEFQKSSGSPHGHIQLFVQCLHQHENLADIFSLAKDRLALLRADYLRYEIHVRRSIYDKSPKETEEALRHAEQQWPEYISVTNLISRPAYQRGVLVADCREDEEARWSQAYLEDDVFSLQTLKQNHVHCVNPETGMRRPQPGCLKADGCPICKHGYPKTQEMSAEACILCPCALKAFDLPDSGRKNCLCMLHGPRDEEYVNPTHPALLSGARCNSDVQLPYRLPFACENCQEACEGRSLQKMVLFAAQRAQDAQTGYSCDYCAKTQPMAFLELKELQKSHAAVAEQTKAKGLAYQGKRHMTRFMSDAYCKGIVRGHAECSNLRCYATEDAASAERITTTQYVSFPGHDFLRHAELAANAMTARDHRITATTLGKKRPALKQRQVTEHDIAEFYARRPRASPCWYLSAYEFLLYWEVIPTRTPRNLKEWQDRRQDAWDVVLTKKGETKLVAAEVSNKSVRFIPGVDTRLRDSLPSGYVAFDDRTENARIRSAWLLRRRRRPRCPTFAHCPTPRYQQDEQENNSFMCLVYFRPWTGLPACADRDVRSIQDFREEHTSWEVTFRTWLQGVACRETKKHVSNFLSVYRVRSLAADVENSDNECEDDTRAHVHAANIDACLRTRETRQGGANEYDDIEAVWQASACDANVETECLPEETAVNTHDNRNQELCRRKRLQKLSQGA
ncbi:unnamed protein product [Symbiodinium sp. CCMP2592]|nr:unnamed protein product [Symbiodinium sp. CCMP2592]